MLAMPGDLNRFSLYSFSTWSHKTKEARSGNGATQNKMLLRWKTSVLPWSCLNCSQWQTYNLTLLSKQKSVSIALPGASHDRSDNPDSPSLPASFMNTDRVPRVQLPESIRKYWTPTYESNHKVYIQAQGCYGHLSGEVEITLVICSPGSKQSTHIRG